MDKTGCDIAIVGGGLSGGLIAAALQQHRPDLSVALIESGTRPGGNHRWSWFSSDLSPMGAEAEALLALFPHARWDGGYDVRFPALERHLSTPYNSLSSTEFAAALENMLPPGTIMTGRQASRLTHRQVKLDDGSTIDARSVIDCRGHTESRYLGGGYQVFYGRHLRSPTPHNIEHPVIMDAMVRQHGSYRFVYVLPLSDTELFLEDTYYSDGPELDQAELSARIDRYCERHRLQGETISEETGVLPVITGGDFPKFQREQRLSGVAIAGARGGFVHPLTSYTLPFAVDTALAIVRAADMPGHLLADQLEERARNHWRATGYYRMLGSMLFGAAEPEERFRIFERFYRLREPLIERFYSARSTPADRFRVLCGKPPVPIFRALRTLIISRRKDFA
ncbi:lycopene beta-cyclase CrtY [Altericroceibacterium endophyticum]|uniref:Lycopene beta-cyclase CrtY n=1 Tax=Altericroceibacterium endophyticum TaxID=1808508 RepID=A0A6I4TB86_9SPHN|nr:lycopene beta-cyclase CrtY [Altericroceibacterium endophyticum]MXO66995.1 lycopene beta-cyclase CrtY [Altericroceibacterium endophyticum]